ncbi:LamG domain-containing protein [Acinetobacter ursingii]|uniref:LamG domain-containing protein n=1 Tax=Acinetobacter ursingii TaxID=108980 RepID=UPI00124F7A18|nr:LamG domain-containing protein [Acinetobacter ursingii]
MTNRLELNWKLDGFVDEQRYYCSETPIDVNNLPVPKAIIAGDARTYTDTAIEVGKTSYVAVSSVKGSIEKVSQVIKVVAGGDPHWDKVVALLHFDGNLTDEKGGAWTAYNYSSGGVMGVTTSNLKFGTGALRHTGRDKALCRPNFITSNTEAFTFEVFIYLDNLTGPIYDQHVLFSQSVNSAYGEQMICIGLDGAADQGKLVWYIGGAHGISRVIKSNSPCVAAKQWTHVAICFDGVTLRAFSKGVKVIEEAASVGWIPNANDFMLGMALVPMYAEYRRGFNGYIDELRITKGVARYTTDFTPPDAPFPSY